MNLSVVIPCYNDGAYLAETIDRLKQQSFQHFEIIIVNDGSDDALTLQVLRRLKDAGHNIIDTPNRKLPSARNTGIEASNAEFIVTLDADDYFHPSFFEKALNHMQANNRAGVVTSYMTLFGTVTGNSKPRGGNAYNFLFSNQCPACALFRRQCWVEAGGYDEAMTQGYEDWEYYIRVTKLGWQIDVLPEFLFFYRQTKKSMHANQTEPNRKAIIDYIVEKHKQHYADCLKEMIREKEIIYTEARVSYQNILNLLAKRLRIRKYKRSNNR